MKSKSLTSASVITLLAALAAPVQMAAQHTRYKLIDLGTLGGPNNFGAVSQGVGLQILNNRGIVTGSAETPIPDPYAPNCSNPDCLVSHAFRWHNGTITDLGALPGLVQRKGRVSMSPVPSRRAHSLRTHTPTPLSVCPRPRTGWPVALEL
jgi:hypothetical protein